VDIFVLIVTVPVLLLTLSAAFRSGADSLNWELRWLSLDPADRTRISAEARSRTKPDDPEEAELAAGLNRRHRRRSAYFEAPLFFIVVAFTALSLAGFGGGFAGAVLAAAGIGSALWSYFGEKRLNTADRVATTPDAGL
jgi:hypothetical protein